MKQRIRQTIKKLSLVCGLALLIFASDAMAAAKVKHVVTGSIVSVSKATKTIVVKTAEGTVETVKWTGKMSVKGLTAGAKGVDLVGREGAHIIVHYTAKGAVKTAHGVVYIGKETPKVAVGTVKVAGKGVKTLTVLTVNGAAEVFDLSKTAVVYSGKGVASAAKFAAKGTADGVKVTVHYTVVGGRKVVHLIKRL